MNRLDELKEGRMRTVSYCNAAGQSVLELRTMVFNQRSWTGNSAAHTALKHPVHPEFLDRFSALDCAVCEEMERLMRSLPVVGAEKETNEALIALILELDLFKEMLRTADLLFEVLGVNAKYAVEGLFDGLVR